jgi:ribosomal protein S18 acetylase RimI-like enzyme
MEIIQSRKEDAEQIALIVSEANKDVAELFNITIENTPKHPSFYTTEWVLSDFRRGEQYFLYKDEGIANGCVAFEQPDPETAYLNRLSVLPDYRHNGIGSRLVKYICEYSKSKKIQAVSIGIIAEHTVLKNWYLDLGFIEGEKKTFDHLPFNVLYMRYNL